ncbi:MAG: ribose-phosphate pyrophosphokinase [Candidatus Diapherotrites archaeon]|nr:ribose-phosphate pyrophosphokinase [Candidatus Diapherotrites archaeon]
MNSLVKKVKIFSGSSNSELAKEIALILKSKLGNVELKKFKDGESYVNFLEKVRGEDVFLVQSTGFPQNDNLMELFLMIDAARRASAGKITAVIPYYGYAKQDRRVADREPISAKLVANLLKAAGADKALLMDLHTDQIQGFFEMQADFVYAAPAIIDYLKKKKLKDLVVVSPDVGSVKRARAYAKRLDAELAIIDKRRPKQNMAEVMNVIGEINEKNCLIVDDEINTGGTIINAIHALKKRGAKDIFVAASHAVLAGDAVKNLQNSEAKEVIVTNSISIPKEKHFSKLKIVSVAVILGQAIQAMHSGKSLSEVIQKQLK